MARIAGFPADSSATGEQESDESDGSKLDIGFHMIFGSSLILNIDVEFVIFYVFLANMF